MRNIRIGNDIQVRATLKELGEWNSLNIKAVFCYFVNTTGIADNNKYPQFYEPTQYSMNCCGRRAYNVYPNNMYITDPHWFPGYNGFGIMSTPFESSADRFQAPIKFMEQQNGVEAYFPAKAQKYCGTYKVVFVVQLYEYGWGFDNIRTFTIDKGDAFILSETGKDTSCIIDMDQPDQHSVTIVGENIDMDKTTLPNTIADSETLDGTIWLKEGCIITKATVTIGGKQKDYDFVLNNQYVDINCANITEDVVITLETKNVGYCMINITGNNINREKTTVPKTVPIGCDVSGYIYVNEGSKITSATMFADGTAQSYPFTTGQQFVYVDIKSVTNKVITIGIQSDKA